MIESWEANCSVEEGVDHLIWKVSNIFNQTLHGDLRGETSVVLELGCEVRNQKTRVIKNVRTKLLTVI